MPDRTNITIGEITVFSCYNAGPSFMRCRDTKYGVVIGFTKKGNPRVAPLYYQQDQNYMKFAQPTLLLFKSSCVIPGALAVSTEQVFRRGGNYLKNYNHIIDTLHNGKDKRIPTRTRKKRDYSMCF